MVGHLFSRADILKPVDNGRWDIIEVKSGTSVKDINIEDAAFQKYCWEQAGIPINRCYIICINNNYVKHGAIIPEDFFVINDITEKVAVNSESLADKIHSLLDVISSPRCPETSIGQHCSDPYPCALTPDCWEGLPEHNIFTLYYGGNKSYELYASGIYDIADIPADTKLNDKQRIQFNCIVNGDTHIDRDAIQGFLANLIYPLHYLDFETFSTAVPLFDGTRPYQNIPFQFSLHIQPEPGAVASHHEYLASPGIDPRPALLESLHQYIGPEGNVIAYNKSFEARVLSELGDAFPVYAEWTQNIIERLVDLIVPFRDFSYYHPSQMGSASLKKVLPALTGITYDNLAIGKGDDASLSFLEYAFGNAPPDNPEQLRKDLLIYCKQDTEGMVYIINKLADMIREPVQYTLFPENNASIKKYSTRRKHK